jgi:thiol-disulfide isomerase/thioredoxin
MKHWIFPLVACLTGMAGAAHAARAPSGPAVGTLAPEFTAHNLVTGEAIPLSSQRGKLVIVTFWATWCGPCRREIPVLENAQRIIGKDRLTVFAVNYRDRADATALKKLAAHWNLQVIDDWSGGIAAHYRISSIPHLFIIGRDGRVLANHLGYGDRTLDELVADINRALADPAPTAPEVPPSITGGD